MIFLKTESEIAIMKQGGKILRRILEKLQHEIKPGITPLELSEKSLEFFQKENVKPSFLKYKGYPTPICVSVNDQIVHGIPNQRPFEKGDLVSIDAGAKFQKYHLDAAFTVAVGKVDKVHLKLIKASKDALEKAIIMAQPGNHLFDISHTIQETIEKAGFEPVRECTGHGIGKKLHEDPQVPNFGKAGEGIVLEPGLVIAIEPMALENKTIVKIENDGWTVSSFDGCFTAHFEDTVAITKNGPKVLTRN